MKTKKISILGKTKEELEKLVTALDMKKFVAKQLMDWIYKKYQYKTKDFSNISEENRQILEENIEFEPLHLIEKIKSKEENAIKLYFKCQDGQRLETVVLKEKNYNTLCVSSQCGCPLDCKFCVTGIVGFKRQLTKEEIIAQVLVANNIGYPITNIVFMGMGEPLLNYDQVLPAIHAISAEWGLNISKRKITVSTAGYQPGIKRLMKENEVLNIAFSVGSVDPKKRLRLMPIEKRFPILEFSRVLWQYQQQHNRKLTLEYTLLENVNDTPLDIKLLINLAKYLNAKVNLINLNPHPKIPFKELSIKKLRQLQKQVEESGVDVTIRYKKGQDIAAACGQLGETLLE
ncbi:MAG: 23S rRNA (adenine(2503)-C(2))-methyltransferase RlmN [bacterium]